MDGCVHACIHSWVHGWMDASMHAFIHGCMDGLTFIINQSITNGIFPNAWKRARVSPIFKEGRRTDPNNYRPISVLPVVSKLIERVVFNQLYEYLNNNNLLTESQSGFRPMFSTETDLLEATK